MNGVEGRSDESQPVGLGAPLGEGQRLAIRGLCSVPASHAHLDLL
jgi:hypothetical protein